MITHILGSYTQFERLVVKKNTNFLPIITNEMLYQHNLIRRLQSLLVTNHHVDSQTVTRYLT